MGNASHLYNNEKTAATKNEPNMHSVEILPLSTIYIYKKELQIELKSHANISFCAIGIPK